MSFPEQERALFDLLFDRPLRDRFCRDPVHALSGYDLDAEERRDFTVIRPDALALDAYLRADFILSHLCRAFPLAFSIASSLAAGLDLLRGLIDTRTMRTPPDDRPATFGTRLREKMSTEVFTSDREKAAVLAIVEAELGMAMTAGALRRSMAAGTPVPPPAPVAPGADWKLRPLQLATFVSATVLPQSYPALKQALRPAGDSELWAQLSRNPLPASVRASTLEKEDPRVLLARARASRPSACDVDVNHATVELSEGFAPLFQHLDGRTSAGEILAQMRRVGTPEALLQGIEAAFRQLLDAGMLKVGR
ncbi:MAG: hypothetical protein HYR49_02900 [Gammaproteobacteria bacterium]|nr:hypothetical protein [Gammaproteobacteria bacterium]